MLYLALTTPSKQKTIYRDTERLKLLNIVSRKPILVTGAFRNGTTWTGRMIANSPYVNLLMERLNPLTPDSLGKKFERFNYPLVYITRQNEGDAYEILQSLLNEHNKLRLPVHNRRRPKRILYTIINKVGMPARPLLKDPAGALAAEWISQRFGADVVVTVRNPAGFVDSFVNKMKWTFDLRDFLDQPDLMKDWLYPFEREIRHPPDDPYETMAVFWRCIYHVLNTYTDRNPHWIVKRHEDVALNPLEAFADIYRYLQLPFGEREKAPLLQSISSENSVEAVNGAPDDIHRHSKAIPKSWKANLPEDTIKKIRELTEEVAGRYYSDIDWM